MIPSDEREKRISFFVKPAILKWIRASLELYSVVMYHTASIYSINYDLCHLSKQFMLLRALIFLYILGAIRQQIQFLVLKSIKKKSLFRRRSFHGFKLYPQFSYSSKAFYHSTFAGISQV